MKPSGWEDAIAVLICLLATGVVVGCASSREASSEGDERSGIQQNRAKEPDQADGDGPVRFHALLEASVADDGLPGCNTPWNDVRETRFGTPGEFCARFRAGEPYGLVPLSVAISDGKVTGVHVQLLYNEVETAKSRFDELVGQFLNRCERKTGGDQHEIISCNTYAVEVGWQLRHDQPEVFLFYAPNPQVLIDK